VFFTAALLRSTLDVASDLRDLERNEEALREIADVEEILPALDEPPRWRWMRGGFSTCTSPCASPSAASPRPPF
jgi:hypothetical protein